MTVPQLSPSKRDESSLTRGISWWDAAADCKLVVSHPSVDRDIWLEFLQGAQRSYRKHGVERVLDMSAIRDGTDTSAFLVAVDTVGHVIGGVRTKGPLFSADDSHALVEWAGQPGLKTLRGMITDRLPFGVVEVKSAWVADGLDRSSAITDALARAPMHSMVLLDAQFAMATAASHVITRWISSGGVVANRISATPYPDHRYQTKIMWWDRNTFASYAESNQASTTLVEMMALNRRLNELQNAAGPQVSSM
jgi:hypothetical protein